MANIKDKLTAFLDPESKSGSEADALLAYCMVDIKKDGYVHLSPTPSCTDWVAVPENLVSDITPLQEIECGDHSHAFCAVDLVDSSDATEKALLELILFCSKQLTIHGSSDTKHEPLCSSWQSGQRTCMHGTEHRCHFYIQGNRWEWWDSGLPC